MSQKFRILFCVVVTSLFFVGVKSACADNARASLERNPIRFDETAQLILEIDQRISDQTLDLSILEQDFVVRGSSSSTQLSIVNGATTSSTRWLVRLEPKREGAITIPSIEIGSAKTQPLSLMVLAPNTQAAGTPRDVFLDVNISPDQPYVQAQITYTVQLYISANIVDGSLSEPQAADAIVEKLGDDKMFEARRDNVRYRVVERKYAIFPQRSGELTIQPIRFEGQIAERRGSGNTFNRFQYTQQIETRSKAFSLQIQPRPAGFQGNVWLPARELTLNEAWSQNPPEFRVGEPITRTLTLRGVGLSGAQLPELSAQTFHGVRTYPDQANTGTETGDDWVIGFRQERTALVPTEDGDLLLPELRLPWWNTQTDQLEYAVVPARKVVVLPALATSDASVPDKEILSKTTAPAEVTQSLSIKGDGRRWLWPMISMVLVIAWLITLAAWWRQRADKTGNQSQNIVATDNGARELKEIKKCCLANDAQATRLALLRWAKNKWPQVVTLQEMTRRLDDDAFTAAVNTLNRYLYRHPNSEQQWRGEELWQQFTRVRSAEESRRQPKPDPHLPGLHPSVNPM